MRTPKIDWEAYKEQLLHLKYEEKKSLKDINEILYAKLGKCVTNARLSQVFTKWRKERESVNEQYDEDRREFEKTVGV